MKLLMFLAKQFTFRPFEKTLPDAGDGGGKNVKWIAGKRTLKNIVLHSFTHLADASRSASPQFAETFLQSAAMRLRNTGYQVTLTPFGWVCEWDLSVFGESLAKV